MKRGRQGFTLLEVLVAMVVLALSLGAAIHAAGTYTVNQAYLRDRTFAGWVARNQLVSVQLAGQWPAIGQQKGEAGMPQGAAEDGGREWRWVMQVTQTPEEDLRRLDIDVYPVGADDKASAMASLSGFIGKPQ